MKDRKFVKSMMVLMMVALLGFGFHVYAADPAADTPAVDSQRPMMGQMGPGTGGKAGMGGMDWKQRNPLNLSAEEMEKFEAERTAFREATKDLKREINQKHLELQSEMAKKAPDAKKAGDIQKQLSSLKAQMDQKRLEHQFNLKKINPDLGSGMGGFHKKGMMDKGRHSQRPCQM